jgi:hypothetical protein
VPVDVAPAGAASSRAAVKSRGRPACPAEPARARGRDSPATIQIAHFEKEGAAGTYKGSFGHHPLGAWCDNTGEQLVFRLRPGNAGAVCGLCPVSGNATRWPIPPRVPSDDP